MSLALPPIFADTAVSRGVGPLLIYLPPVPPVLGDPVPESPARSDPWPAPAALASYVHEPFYAPLSTQFAKNAIGDELEYRLTTYRAAKTALQAELRARIDTTRDLAPDARLRVLAAFALEQTPRVAALEKDAQAIRRDLAAREAAYSELRRWEVRFEVLERPSDLSVNQRIDMIRLQAAYRADLSATQRRLLEGIALKLADEPNAKSSSTAAGATNPIFYFFPESARLRIAPGLPDPLAAQIREFRETRYGIEIRLYRTLLGPLSAQVTRAQALSALDQAEGPAIAHLEELAESIRTGLSAIRDPAQTPDLQGMPRSLADQIDRYRKQKHALQSSLLAEIEAVKTRPAKADDPPLADRIRAAITAFASAHADIYADLARQAADARARLSSLSGTESGSRAQGGPAGGGDADALLRDFTEAREALRVYWDYRDYSTAVLQPGLSPEQRRLLFDGAVEKLALPLPGAKLGPSPP